MTASADSPIGLVQVPLALLALEALARLANDAGMRSVTYQALTKLFTESRSLIVMLAHLDTIMAWRPTAANDLGFPGDRTWRLRYVNVAKALLLRAQRGARAPLARVLCAHLPPEGLERVTFLKRLAQRLVGGLVPFEQVAKTGAGAPREPRCSTGSSVW